MNNLRAKSTQLRPMAMFPVHCCLLPVTCFFMLRLSRFASCYFLLGVWCSFRCRRCFLRLVAAGAFFIRLVAAGTLYVTLSQVFLVYRRRLFLTLVRLLFSRLLGDPGRECRIWMDWLLLLATCFRPTPASLQAYRSSTSVIL